MTVRSLGAARYFGSGNRRARRWLTVGLIAAGAMLGAPSLSLAATFNVAGTGDSTAACSGSSCPSLRSAVLASNAAGGTNTINVPAGTYTLTITPSGTDNGMTGDLHITANVTIAGAGSGSNGTTIVGDSDRIFDISAASVTLSGLAITSGSGEQFGGAIKTTGASLTLTNDAFTGNTTTSSGFGGAVYDPGPVTGTAALTVTGSTFTSNIAAETGTSQGGFGGAISFEPSVAGTLTITNSEFDSNTAQSGTTSGGGFGGGIDFEPPAGSTLTVTGSTFSGNAAAGSSSQGGFGGGIEFEPGNNSPMTVTNSTFTGNSAGGASGFGGAISFEPGGGSSLAITHSTIVGNTASRANQGGGLDIEDAPATITNSIVSANTAAGATNNCQVFSPATLTVQGHNIELGTTCGFDINADPKVAALANNGGPTKTMALLTGSPAIDAAAPSFCPATDQRGFTRPDQAGTPCDIGAFEFTVTPPPPSPPTNTRPPVVTGTPEPGHPLNCSTGTWTGSPTQFAYRWNRQGAAISGANGVRYTVQVLDEAAQLSCTVTATNAGGSTSATSKGVLVAVPGTLRCPKPSGRLSGIRLGPLALGTSRARARHALKRFRAQNRFVDDFCLFAGWGIRVGYASPKLLGELPASQRGRVAGRIVLALTANPFYVFDGIRPGLTLAVAQRRLRFGKRIRLGANDWYFAVGKAANIVLKVRHGVIYELGIADKRLSSGRPDQIRLLRGFPSG